MKKKLIISLLVVAIMLSTINLFSFAVATPVITATIPKFKVVLNNQVIDNSNNRYPLLVYKNITYFPMTWDYTQALGLKTSWDETEGFSISKDATAKPVSEVKQDLSVTNNIDAPNVVNLASFNIKVNGKEVNNATEEYPLLVFRDITYFPMTWRFAVEEFGLKTNWNDQEGFNIGSEARSTTAIGATKQQLEPSEIAASIGPAVVYIETYDKNGKELYTGSGFIVEEGGKVVTNYHVIEDAHSIYVKVLNRSTYPVEKVMAYDIDRDIAVLRIGGSNLPTVKLGDSSNIVTGQRVLTIGSPLGLENTISEGLISNKNRIIDGYNYIQTSAPISSGSSGGVLLDYSGEVIGVTVGSYIDGQNMNLVVPINEVTPYLAQDMNLTITEMKDQVKANQELVSYDEYVKHLVDNAAVMIIANRQYLIGFTDITLEEISDEDGNKKLRLAYYVGSENFIPLLTAIGGGHDETLLDLFYEIVGELEQYYEMDIEARIIYYENRYKTYPPGLDENDIVENTITFNEKTNTWEVWFPVLHIDSIVTEENYHYLWFTTIE